MTLVTNKQDVFSRLRQSREKLRRLGVEKVGLFGSFARGQQSTGSDVDLLVKFRRDRKTFDNFMALSFLLEELFERRVEIVTPEALSPYIGPHILGEVEYASLAD